ncbi:MAG TPA: response regulator [Polyangia bacterium]
MNKVALSCPAISYPDSSPTATPPERSPPRATLRILLAESDSTLRRLIALVLRADGHDVIEAADGSDLLEAVASLLLDDEHPIDVIMAAQALSGIPGTSVLEGIRARGGRMPFVLVTGDALSQQKARRLGAVALCQPFDAAAIRLAVRNAAATSSAAAGP